MVIGHSFLIIWQHGRLTKECWTPLWGQKQTAAAWHGHAQVIWSYRNCILHSPSKRSNSRWFGIVGIGPVEEEDPLQRGKHPKSADETSWLSTLCIHQAKQRLPDASHDAVIIICWMVISCQLVQNRTVAIYTWMQYKIMGGMWQNTNWA